MSVEGEDSSASLLASEHAVEPAAPASQSHQAYTDVEGASAPPLDPGAPGGPVGRQNPQYVPPGYAHFPPPPQPMSSLPPGQPVYYQQYHQQYQPYQSYQQQPVYVQQQPMMYQMPAARSGPIVVSQAPAVTVWYTRPATFFTAGTFVLIIGIILLVVGVNRFNNESSCESNLNNDPSNCDEDSQLFLGLGGTCITLAIILLIVGCIRGSRSRPMTYQPLVVSQPAPMIVAAAPPQPGVSVSVRL